jgi:organic hydroperoxide reductase OsmC/OhrA
MSEHRATVEWTLTDGDFLKGKYSRVHTWTFDGGMVVKASPTPAVVPAPYSDPSAVDPEEAFVAAISSCHMLTFLYVASRAGFEVLSYHDPAVGVLSKDAQGIPWISTVDLKPQIVYRQGLSPTSDVEQQLHARAHKQCFIANSVKTDVRIASQERVAH